MTSGVPRPIALIVGSLSGTLLSELTKYVGRVSASELEKEMDILSFELSSQNPDPPQPNTYALDVLHVDTDSNSYNNSEFKQYNTIVDDDSKNVNTLNHTTPSDSYNTISSQSVVSTSSDISNSNGSNNNDDTLPAKYFSHASNDTTSSLSLVSSEAEILSSLDAVTINSSRSDLNNISITSTSALIHSQITISNTSSDVDDNESPLPEELLRVIDPDKEVISKKEIAADITRWLVFDELESLLEIPSEPYVAKLLTYFALGGVSSTAGYALKRALNKSLLNVNETLWKDVLEGGILFSTYSLLNDYLLTVAPNGLFDQELPFYSLIETIETDVEEVTVFKK